jgi:hypothetical protein
MNFVNVTRGTATAREARVSYGENALASIEAAATFRASSFQPNRLQTHQE